MPLRLGELAIRFGCELRGDPEAAVAHVATLGEAGPGALSFLANPKYRKHLAATRATAVVVDAGSAAACPTNALVAGNPYATYARIAQVLHPQPPVRGGRHPSAVVEPDAQVDGSAWIGPGCYVGAGVTLGPRVELGPGTVVLDGAWLGADTRCVARVTVCRGVRIGERCLLHPGAVIGGDGFGHAPDRDGYVKVPQVGAVRLGDDVEIGSNTAVDRGTIDDTVIERGVRIDNLVQVGHNCRIGEHTVIAGCAGISGSTTIGRRCMIGGQAGIAGHLQIADDVYVNAKTAVTHSLTRPGLYSGTLGVDEARRFRRNAARFQGLDGYVRRLQRLERALGGGTGPAERDDGPDTEQGS